MTTRRTVLIGLDQGTTNTKALAIDGEGRVLAEASLTLASRSPTPGVVEQDPEQMFANSIACIRTVLERANSTAADVLALGMSNQTETLVIWEKETGRSVMPAMVWQCRRGQEEVSALRTEANKAFIREKTGLDLDPTFTAVKLMWIDRNRLDIAAGLRDGTLCWGTVDTWLRWKLSGGKAYTTEPGNASRTMLFDINRGKWDRDLLDFFGLHLPVLPEVSLSTARGDVTAAGLFDREIPMTASLGDQQASLFGHGCHAAGDLKITYGTGAFAWMNMGNTARKAPEGIIRTIAWDLGRPTYAFEGFVMYAGAILDWLASRFGFSDGGAGVARAAAEVRTSNSAILVPAFQGLAAPWWKPEANAMLAGLTPAITAGHIAHAALESIAWQIRILLADMGTAATVSIDGGVTRQPYFLQLQADALNLPLARAAVESTSPYGAALAAGLGAGHWGSLEEIRPLIQHDVPVAPKASDRSGFDRWHRWVDAAIAVSEA